MDEISRVPLVLVFVFLESTKSSRMVKPFLEIGADKIRVIMKSILLSLFFGSHPYFLWW